MIFVFFKINPSTGVINFSEEVGKTFLWKSISKSKDNEKPSRSAGIKNKFVVLYSFSEIIILLFF